MRTFLRSLLLFASIFAAAHVARILIVPNAAPIAEGEEIELANSSRLLFDVGPEYRFIRNGPHSAGGAAEPS